MRRAALCVLASVAIAGCSPAQGDGNASQQDGATEASVDTGRVETSADSSARDSDAPVVDAKGDAVPETCVPRACTSSDCGAVPDDVCGGVLSCGPCGSAGDVYCTAAPSTHQKEVTDAVNKVMADHPEYFDPTLYRATSSWLVTNDAAYTTAVVGNCNGAGTVVCQSDPLDDHEIRVRGVSDHRAENYGVRVHSTNRTWDKFMGGYCETTAF
jgi:hypothetical protein